MPQTTFTDVVSCYNNDMTEASFQTEFTKWLRYRYRKTGAYELKVTNTNRIAFSAVRPHQKIALRNTKHGFHSYKIPDAGYDQKPYDCYAMFGEPAWICVMFYRRKCIHFWMVDIDVWLEKERTHPMRSLTEEDIAGLGSRCELK